MRDREALRSTLQKPTRNLRVPLQARFPTTKRRPILSKERWVTVGKILLGSAKDEFVFEISWQWIIRHWEIHEVALFNPFKRYSRDAIHTLLGTSRTTSFWMASCCSGLANFKWTCYFYRTNDAVLSRPFPLILNFNAIYTRFDCASEKWLSMVKFKIARNWLSFREQNEIW